MWPPPAVRPRPPQQHEAGVTEGARRERVGEVVYGSLRHVRVGGSGRTGRWLWALKDYIDVKWMNVYNVLPEMKEYERTSTTVINAYVLPVVGAYLASLRKGLDADGITLPA